jgi:AcrR family transcriptional regulator
MPASRSRSPRRVRARHGGAPAYHHGDLRRALLDATEAVLEESGIEAFTLREVARRAGVSHGAPAHLFGDVSGLLSTFTVESFEQLAAAMARRRAAAHGDAFGRLTAIGLGYVEFALAHRARFQLMFRTDRLDAQCDPLREAGQRAYQQLVECVAAVDPDAPAAAHAERTALAWSIVHGFATLMVENAAFAASHGPGPRAALATMERLLAATRTSFEGGTTGASPKAFGPGPA